MGPRRGGDACSEARRAEPPIPFCEVEDAPGAAPAGPAALPRCLICCDERPRFAAVGRCGHTEVCWICAVRLRGILHDFRCPVCKEELPEVALVSDAGGEPSPSMANLRDAKLGLVYESAEVQAEVERLFDYTCRQRGCGRTFTTIRGLEKHLRDEHRRQFCATCLRDRKVFLFEQTLYSFEDLERHRREGDDPRRLGRAVPPTPPHAPCSFCKKSFYSQDELLGHMHKRHHLCGICERQGRRSEFYSDYAYLSLHYEERHYVCSHEQCRRGNYRLTAFATEDELRMHEFSEHPAASQRSRKQGVRLNLQFGAMSYREERQRRYGGGQAGNSGGGAAEERGAAGGGGGGGAADEARVRFMWTRGEPPRGLQDADEWGDLLDRGDKDCEDEDAERYPPRPHAGSAGASATGAAAPPSGAAAPAPAGAASSIAGTGGAASSSGPWRRRAAAKAAAAATAAASAEDELAAVCAAATRMLRAALEKVRRQGLNVTSRLEAEEYRERNCRFRADLQAAFGAERLAVFQRISASFRQATAEGAGARDVARAVRGYADRVLEVFASTLASVGESVAADLLGELVVLLPDKDLRHSLAQQLRNVLGKMEADLQAPAAAPTPAQQPAVEEAASQRRAPFAQRRDAAAVESAAAASQGARRGGGDPAPNGAAQRAPPPPLPAALEALPPSEAFWDPSDRQPSFVLALDAVLSALAFGDASTHSISVAHDRALARQIGTLEGHQLESLDCMTQHLDAAGAGHLDFAAMDRLLALRPQLLLKLQNQGQEAVRQGALGWQEWKVAAVSAIRGLGSEERCYVQSYVRRCVGLAGGQLQADEVSEEEVEEAFPTLAAALERTADRPKMHIKDSSSAPSGCIELGRPAPRGAWRGRQQRPVLRAWG